MYLGRSSNETHNGGQKYFELRLPTLEGLYTDICVHMFV